MGRRRKAREIVLQALYEAEFSDLVPAEVLSNQIERRGPTADTAEYATLLFSSARTHLVDLDRRIESSLENWDMERVSLVDKNILRLALAELMFMPDVPTKVVINEAIEIAHRFSSEEAGRFINGLLDRFAKELRKGFV